MTDIFVRVYWTTAFLTLLVGGSLFMDVVRDRRVRCLRAAADRNERNRQQLVRLTSDLAAYAVRCEEILGQLQRVWTSPENHEIIDNVDALQAAWCRVAESRPPLTDLGRLLTADDWRAIEDRQANDRG
jgi:hypothetical protein